MKTVTTAQLVEGIKHIREAESIVDGIVTDWWSDLVRFSLSAAGNGEDAEEAAKAALKDAEGQYKEDTGDKSMPGAYRSAKSVIFKAMRLGVDMVKANGHVRGKTEVEKLCKEATDPKSNEDKAMDLLSTVSKVLDKMAENGEDTRRVAETLEHLEIKARAATPAAKAVA